MLTGTPPFLFLATGKVQRAIPEKLGLLGEAVCFLSSEKGHDSCPSP